MKILITGTAGFIGFHLAKRLLERGNTLVGIDRRYQASTRNKQIAEALTSNSFKRQPKNSAYCV